MDVKELKTEIEYITNELISDMNNLQNILSKIDIVKNPNSKQSYNFYRKMRVNMAYATKILMNIQSNMEKYSYTEEINLFLSGRVKTLEEELTKYKVVESLVITDELDSILEIVGNKKELVEKYAKKEGS